jgi:methylsterol monooxygenase
MSAASWWLEQAWSAARAPFVGDAAWVDWPALGGRLREFGVPDAVAGALSQPERWMFAVHGVLLLESVFLAGVLFFFVIDHFDLMPRYRIANNQPYPSRALLLKCASGIAVDHALVRPLILLAVFPAVAWRIDQGAQVPSAATLAWQLLVCSQVDDALFYWAHRAAHHRLLYPWLHKQHHEFKHPVAMSVQYAHPLEDLLVNTVPTVAGPMLLGGHAVLFWFYAALKLHQSIDAHSGYALPFPLSPYTIEWLGLDCARAHDYHHSNNVGNFGGWTIAWDHLMGTDTHYRAHRRKQTKQA